MGKSFFSQRDQAPSDISSSPFQAFSNETHSSWATVCFGWWSNELLMCEAQSWRPPHFINVPVGEFLTSGSLWYEDISPRTAPPRPHTQTHTHTERRLYDLGEDECDLCRPRQVFHSLSTQKELLHKQTCLSCFYLCWNWCVFVFFLIRSWKLKSRIFFKKNVNH